MLNTPPVKYLKLETMIRCLKELFFSFLVKNLTFLFLAIPTRIQVSASPTLT